MKNQLENFSFEDISPILEKIASQYPKDSEEYSVLELCAKALFFVWSKKVKTEFLEFLKTSRGDLNQKQKAFLKSFDL